MISTLFVISAGGDVLVEKQCVEKVARTSLEEYWSAHVLTAGALTDVPAVAQVGRYTYAQVNRNDVVVAAVTTSDVGPMLVIEIAETVMNMIETYLKTVTEEAVRESFSVVFQLLEELLDHGAPLTTELHVLEQLVPRPTLENRVRSLLDASKAKGRGGLTDNGVPWRNPATSHTPNEIFFDVIDYVDAIFSPDGVILKSTIRGSIDVNCRLSGMPDISVHLSNTDFDDVSYHACVRHSRYESDRTISFVPPDGSFSLFRYRVKQMNFEPPFYVKPQISYNPEGGRVNCMVGMRHGGQISKEEKNLHKIVVTFPLPPQTETVNVSQCSHGSWAYDPAAKALKWSIGQLSTHTPTFSGSIVFKNGAPPVEDGTGENVSVSFTLPNHVVSGVRVSSVNIVESYKPFKGVKYMTKSGRYSIHTM
jgi:AP-3 complex subunit mu